MSSSEPSATIYKNQQRALCGTSGRFEVKPMELRALVGYENAFDLGVKQRDSLEPATVKQFPRWL